MVVVSAHPEIERGCPAAFRSEGADESFLCTWVLVIPCGQGVVTRWSGCRDPQEESGRRLGVGNPMRSGCLGPLVRVS